MVIKKHPLYTFLLILLSTNYISNAQGVPGDTSGTEFPVNTYITSSQQNSTVAMDSNGSFVITWQSYDQDGDQNGIYAQRFESNGAAAGTEFQVNTETSSSQGFPSVAMDADGDFIIAWVSAMQDGDSTGIFAQRYNANGTTNGSEFQVNTYVTSFQQNVSVAMDADGDFVIVWESNMQDGDSIGIFAQRYNANGTTNGSEFQVNTVTTGFQTKPSVAMDADGDFVIAWESFDGFALGIYAQLYSNDSSTIGTEFLVNTYTTSFQTNPSVAMDADGDFVIVWQSLGQDSSNLGVYAQRYLANAIKTGSEFRVNTETNSDQSDPSVAMDADGDFVVIWMSSIQDNSFEGIYAQRYDKSSTASGSEYRVNTETLSSQVLPTVTMDADGDFIVSWSSIQDGDSFGIYAQRYEGAGNFVVGTVDLNVVLTDNADPIVTGNELTYTVITTNIGTGIALDLNLSTQLPVGLGYVSHNGGDWSCIEVSNQVICNLAILAAGANSMVTVRASSMGTVGVTSQTASVFAAQIDANLNDNTDTETTTIEASKVTANNTAVSSVDDSGSLGLLSLLLIIPLTLRRQLTHF